MDKKDKTRLNPEVPSNMKLMRYSGIALVLAALITLLFVLPAEYGIDPTGMGDALGLMEMGQFKQSAKDPRNKPNLPVQIPLEVIQDSIKKMGSQEPIRMKNDTIVIQLKTGEAAEIKLVMRAGSSVHYEWFTDTGHVNYDLHADSDTLKYFGYKKGKKLTSDSDNLLAAFTGSHGWFWRNRSKVSLTLRLMVNGEYDRVKRVL